MVRTPSELSALTTEARNRHTMHLHTMSTMELCVAMNDEDQQVALAVQRALPQISQAIDRIAERMRKGGRLFYCGAGTSGRLGVLDAAECVPTFSAAPGQVIGCIAGGPGAMLQAVEGAEDNPALGEADLRAHQLGAKDIVVGIAASGRTPYVLGSLAFGRQQQALTIAVVCNEHSAVASAADLAIEVVTGPEILTGSTRLKAGTATKLVLNMLSTGAFVRLHKVYGNLMVDLQATNEKLVQRRARIVAQAASVEMEPAEAALRASDGEVKTALVVLRKGVSPAQARTLLFHCDGDVAAVLQS